MSEDFIPEKHDVIEQLRQILKTLDSERVKSTQKRYSRLLHCCMGNGFDFEFTERSVRGGRRGNQSLFDIMNEGDDVERASPISELNVASLESTLDSIATYSMSLHRNCIKNIGLDHGKVREYWIKRGPRMGATMVIFSLYSILLTELTGDVTNTDRLRSLAIGGCALIIAFYMLFHRLPDSIDSSICRSAHDFYVQTKKNFERN